MSWWPWRRRSGNGAAKARADAEAKLRAAQRFSADVERLADHVAALPADEFLDRVSRAFRRPT